jgi:hypothetical protein
MRLNDLPYITLPISYLNSPVNDLSYKILVRYFYCVIRSGDKPPPNPLCTGDGVSILRLEILKHVSLSILKDT